ncbi:hypothetical protein EV401DRAFT_1892131 [Pisolithus croceorrhizus]|nr:hypothetical protein EV401DRAFT_1892131 [Pisolithus croceorrhizus]
MSPTQSVSPSTIPSTLLQNEQAEEARRYFPTVFAAWSVMPKPTGIGEGLTPKFSLHLPFPQAIEKNPPQDAFLLVLKGVCQPMCELRSLDTMFGTLLDAHQVLDSLGWVYRDVSAGNVLRAGQAGKLADLEYANQVDSRTTHEVFMATLDFMTCEVEAQGYLFVQPKAVHEDFMSENGFGSHSGWGAYVLLSGGYEFLKPPFLPASLIIPCLPSSTHDTLQILHANLPFPSFICSHLAAATALICDGILVYMASFTANSEKGQIGGRVERTLGRFTHHAANRPPNLDAKPLRWCQSLKAPQ